MDTVLEYMDLPYIKTLWSSGVDSLSGHKIVLKTDISKGIDIISKVHYDKLILLYLLLL